MANNSLNDIEGGGSFWTIILLPVIPITLGVACFMCYKYKRKYQKLYNDLRNKGDELWRVSAVVTKKLREDYENLLKQFKDAQDKISSDGWPDKAEYKILEAKANNFSFQNEGA